MSVRCPHCVNGTWLGPNGARWRCAFCNGTGQVKDPEPPTEEGEAQ